MSLITMVDDGIEFDGRTMEQRALGGAESAFVELAEALAALGHRVLVRNNCTAPLTHKGVDWAPLASGLPARADLFICNRSPKYLKFGAKAGQVVLWIHNPAQYLAKLKNQLRLGWHRPVIVFSGKSHLSTYPSWAFDGGREIIPYGISPRFRGAVERPVPGPRAIFTSNPMRSLSWLLDLWAERVRPAVPAAELHVFSGMATYGSWGKSKAAVMVPVLERCAAMADQGVVLRGPVSKDDLVGELAQARALLYRGDIGETFCYAAAESQAMGVPGVVQDIACMAERFVDGQTGFVVGEGDDAAFAAAAIKLLSDDDLWRTQHRACLATQRGLSWAEVAQRFAALMDD
jgi:glycosyltransferase involved in cell wall biosynthesis